jgi:hypothetical protein
MDRTRIKIKQLEEPNKTLLDFCPEKLMESIEVEANGSVTRRAELLADLYKLTVGQIRQQQNEFKKYLARHGHLFVVDDDGNTLKGIGGMPICLDLPLSRPQQMTAYLMLFEMQRDAIAEALAHLERQAELHRRSRPNDITDDEIFREGDD